MRGYVMQSDYGPYDRFLSTDPPRPSCHRCEMCDDETGGSMPFCEECLETCSEYRGDYIYFASGKWRYLNGEPVEDTHLNRPCGKCGLQRDENGHDACLGTLPGVMNACCGHGNTDEAYVQMEDGTIIQGLSALSLITKMRTT